jgi:hypothetical protein
MQKRSYHSKRSLAAGCPSQLEIVTISLLDMRYIRRKISLYEYVNFSKNCDVDNLIFVECSYIISNNKHYLVFPE